MTGYEAIEEAMRVEQRKQKPREQAGTVPLTAAAVDSLSRLLVEKGIVTEKELRNRVSSWMDEHGFAMPKTCADRKSEGEDGMPESNQPSGSY